MILNIYLFKWWTEE